MKIFYRFLVLVLCAMPLVFLSSCAATSTALSFTERKGWQFNQSSTKNGEQITFTATRYAHSGNDKTEIASGQLSFLLREGRNLGSPTEATLTTNLSLLFNENSDAQSRTDSISSEVVFSTASLIPISSQKTLTLESFVPTRGFVAETDYEALTSSVTPIGEEKATFNLKSGSYYDNEQLYHLVRGIPNLTAGKTYSFSLLTPLDMYASGKFFTHKIEVVVASELVRLEVPKSIFDMAIPRTGEDSGKINNDGVYELDCLILKISLAAEKSGPSIYMYVSDLIFVDNESIRENHAVYASSYTKNVPIKIVTSEYSINSAQTHSNEYTIQSYTTLV